VKLARGAFYLLLAEAVFVAAGYLIHVGAGRILDPRYYGTLGILLSLLSHYRIFLATGVNRAVSLYVSRDPSLTSPIRRQALKIQLLLGIGLGALIFLFAPVLAGWWQDGEMTAYIRLTAFFIPIFGVYSVYRGELNGKKLFDREAIVFIFYSILKVIFVFILIIPFRIFGAVTAYLAAIVAATFLARWKCPRPEPNRTGFFPAGAIIGFAFPVVLYSFTISLIQSLDLYFVRALVTVEKGMTAAQASGYYTCAQQFARIPYMALYALSLALFPYVAAGADGNPAGGNIRNALRLGLLLAWPLTLLISAFADNMVVLVYRPEYGPAAGALQILVLGLTFLAFGLVLTTVLTAAGRPWTALALVTFTLLVSAALNYVLVPKFDIRGAAAATTIAAFLGTIAAGIMVTRHFGRILKPGSAMKIFFAGIAVWLAAVALKPMGWLFLPLSVLLGGLYLLILAGMKEFGNNEIGQLKSIFRRTDR